MQPQSGDAALTIATQMRCGELVDVLLRHGAGVNYRNDHGITALMCAAIGGDREAMGRLIARGADVDAQAQNGMTALMLAAMADDRRGIDQLLRAGASPNLHNRFGRTALDLAQSPPCRAALAAAGARP